jgi:putative ABC transport system permease protein
LDGDFVKQDISYALRIFAKAPGFTAVVIFTLALGIGANTAIFSIVQAVLLRPLAYRDPGRLVVIWDRGLHEKGLSKLFDMYRDFDTYQKNNHSFEKIAGATWAVNGRILTGHGRAQTVLAIPATVDFFTLLGVAPEAGRTFTSEDMARGCSVVLEHRFWQNSLGGDKSIVGQSLHLDDQECTVLGVMPASFAFYPDQTSMWSLITPNHPIVRDPDRNGIGVFARLKPGMTIEAAEAEVLQMHRSDHGTDRHGGLVEPVVYPLQDEFTFLTGRNLRLSIIVLFAAVSVVLLIACVNVANLLLGRAMARQKELAVRTALGSGRTRLIRQLLTESLLLSIAAAIVGTGIAALAVHYFQTANPIDLPPGEKVELSLPVLAFTALLAVLTSLVFGFLPAWKASRIDVNSALKATGRGSSADSRRQWLGKSLVVIEVMLSLLLLVGAGLLIQSVSKFSAVPLGFSTDRLMTMSLSLPRATYQKPETRVRFFDSVLASMSSLPETEAAAISTAPPLQGAGTLALSILGRPDGPPAAMLHDVAQVGVSGGYFQALGIPISAGRTFDARDQAGAPLVVVVNEALVRRYFRSEDPIGKQIRAFGVPEPLNPWLTIAGVAGNEKRTALAEMTWLDSPTIYIPITQRPPGVAQLILRTASAQARVGAAVQQRLAEIDPGVPVTNIDTVQHMVSRQLAYPQFRAVLFGAFAVLALVLAVVGLYGVIAQLVEQRTHEIGVRMALGAQQSDVLKMVIGEGLTLAVLGVGLGLMAAAGLAQFIAALLYGVGATDVVTMAGGSGVLIAAAFLATYVPARRATRVEPVVALRYE